MQTGRFVLVAIDLLLDMVLFNILINVWVVKLPVEDVSEAAGITTFLINVFKSVVYVGWSSRKSQIKTYQFFNWAAEVCLYPSKAASSE